MFLLCMSGRSVSGQPVSGTDGRPVTSVPRRGGLACLALMAALFVSACETTGGPNATNAPPNSPQAQLAARQQQYNMVTAQGCVAGAVMGTIIGAIFGGGRGAAIGAGAGTVAGCGAGLAIAGRNLDRQEQQDVLNNRIALAEQSIQSQQEGLRLSRQIVEQEKAQIQRLRAQTASGQRSRAQMTSELAQIDNSITVIRGDINKGQQAVAAMNKDIADMESAGIATEDMRERQDRLRGLLKEQETVLETLIAERGSLA